MSSSAEDMAEAKRRARHEMAAALVRLAPSERRAASIALAERVAAVPAVAEAATLMAFLSLPTEIDTWPIIRWAWRRGKGVAIPRIEFGSDGEDVPLGRRTMVAVRLDAADVDEVGAHPAVRPGPLGILDATLRLGQRESVPERQSRQKNAHHRAQAHIACYLACYSRSLMNESKGSLSLLKPALVELNLVNLNKSTLPLRLTMCPAKIRSSVGLSGNSVNPSTAKARRLTVIVASGLQTTTPRRVMISLSIVSLRIVSLRRHGIVSQALHGAQPMLDSSSAENLRSIATPAEVRIRPSMVTSPPSRPRRACL